ncbi:MAG: hypothetical protein Kow00104_15570 [Rhodothalassiaceae bacterium]
MSWILENGAAVTEEDLADEIFRVPRTKFWRLSHIVLIWPEGSDPSSGAETGGFGDGFAIELVAVEGGVDWLLQPVGETTSHRVGGRAPDGRSAVRDVFATLESLMDSRRSARRQGGS